MRVLRYGAAGRRAKRQRFGLPCIVVANVLVSDSRLTTHWPVVWYRRPNRRRWEPVGSHAVERAHAAGRSSVYKKKIVVAPFSADERLGAGVVPVYGCQHRMDRLSVGVIQEMDQIGRSHIDGRGDPKRAKTASGSRQHTPALCLHSDSNISHPYQVLSQFWTGLWSMERPGDVDRGDGPQEWSRSALRSVSDLLRVESGCQAPQERRHRS
jgi:hypothetical protein